MRRIGDSGFSARVGMTLPAGNTLEMVVDFAGFTSQPVNLLVASP